MSRDANGCWEVERVVKDAKATCTQLESEELRNFGDLPKGSAEKGVSLMCSENKFLMRPELGPSFVLKFVRSRVLRARFLQPFPKSLVTVKYSSNKNGR